MIEVPAIAGGFSEPKPRRLLNQILEARARETFELIAAEVDDIVVTSRAEKR